MGKSAASRRQTGRVGQLLFVAQQAAQALAIERLEPLGLSPRAWGVLSTLAYWGLRDEQSAIVISVLVGFTYMTATLIQLDLAAGEQTGLKLLSRALHAGLHA